MSLSAVPLEDHFRIETDRLLLVWSAVRQGRSRLVAESPSAGEPWLVARRADLRFGPDVRRARPRIFEQVDYALFLRSSTGAPLVIEHRDPAMLRDLELLDGGRVIHGRVNFGSQVGRSVFAVLVGGQPELDFEVEVFPTKLDYAEDYERLIADTEEIQTALILEYLRSTFRPGRAVRVRHSTNVEWLTLLREAAGELERGLGQIARHPRWSLAREPQEIRAEQARRPDATLRRSMTRNRATGRGGVNRGLATPERLEERRARPTLDTAEHRWLAAQLLQIRRRLAGLRRAEAKRPATPRRKRIREEIDVLETHLEHLSRIEPLIAATDEPLPGFASLQLLSSPGYREAYRACVTLLHGLSMDDGPVRLALKDLHLLYEQWCFLTFVRLVVRQTGQPLPARQLLARGASGLRVLLASGREHRLRFRTPSGVRIALTYNPRFGGEPLLVPQQPDILLEVRRQGGPPVRAVFDAKYRLDASSEYLERYGSPGPPEDALNGLHRYRDAIVGPAAASVTGDTPARVLTHAIALFPHREPEAGAYRKSRLWRSIERIGVGAIPLLPGGTQYLAEWVRGIVQARG